MDASFWTIGPVLYWLSTVVALAIFALAVQGYRRNRSRSMLALGSGIVTLSLVSSVGTLLATRMFGVAAAPIANGVSQLLGMCLILYAIVLARRE